MMKFTQIEASLRAVLDKRCLLKLDDPAAQFSWLGDAELAEERGESSFEVSSRYTRDGHTHNRFLSNN